MKKKSILSVVLAGVVTLGLVGCGGTATSGSKDSKNDKVIKIGVTPKPHEEIVNIAKPLLEKEGYTVEITEFNDYNQPNTAVEEGSLDANFFQHTPYLNEQNSSKGYHLVSVGAIHLEPMGLYSKKVKSLDELKDGATIAVPNDPSNEARALKLLAGKGLIKIKDGELVTSKDITENPKNLKFNELYSFFFISNTAINSSMSIGLYAGSFIKLANVCFIPIISSSIILLLYFIPIYLYTTTITLYNIDFILF